MGIECLYGEEQKLGKHSSPYMFPESRIPWVCYIWSSRTQQIKCTSKFLHSWHTLQGIPPISSTMLHEEGLYLHFYLSLTNFLLWPLVLVLEETVKVQSLSSLPEALCILKILSVSLFRISLCQLKCPACSLKWFCTLNFCGVFPWVFLSTTTYCLHVFHPWEPKVSRCGRYLAGHFGFYSLFLFL